MSYVEILNKNKRKEIRMIRKYLLHGDMLHIAEKAEKSVRTVSDTLNIKHPLYSEKVINAAWQYFIEQGRIAERPTTK